ncbi:multidrug ABC transporter ATP-binding protein, partial [Turicibacter sanguinis]|nr:multidrug ABC transporter ATP-binding protein [Turicibacter sanguinis]
MSRPQPSFGPRPGGPGGGPGARFGHQKEKLKNPKHTIRRLLGYIGNQKLAIIIVFILCIITTLI